MSGWPLYVVTGNLFMQLYKASYPVGSQVKIADRGELEHFLQTWKYHNPLNPEQLEFAGKAVVIFKVGFYHGGDPLYVLENVPGVWHEECLSDHNLETTLIQYRLRPAWRAARASQAKQSAPKKKIYHEGSKHRHGFNATVAK